MSGQVLLRVKYDLYEYYINHLTKPERDYILSVLKAVFAKLIEEVRQKKESGQTVKEEERKEFTVVVEHKPAESDTLKIYKKYEALQRELGSKLVELEELKESKRALELEKQKCIQELEQIKKKPELLQKEIQKKEAIARELLDLTNLVLYCFESQNCDNVKLATLLKQRMVKLGVEQTRPNDILLSLVIPK